MTPKELDKYENVLRSVKKQCTCGRRVFITERGYGICDWCGHKVLGDKLKFKEKIKNMIGKRDLE